MSSCSKGQVWTSCPLTDHSEAKVEFFALLLALLALPAHGVEGVCVLEVFFVHGGDAWGAEDVVAGGDDVVGVGDVHGGFDFTHD